MEIKVGDKVRVSKDAPGIYMKTIFPNLVSSNMEVTEIGYGFARIKPLICECEYLTFEFAIPTKYLIKVEDEAKEPKPKYKAGDKVRVLGHALLEGGVFTITLIEHREKRGWMYRINTHTWYPESDLEPYTEPTELVEPKEQTETEKKPNVGSIKIPVEVDLTDSYWEAYTADLAKEIAVKLSKPNENKPGYVADYAVSVAKAVVETLKRSDMIFLATFDYMQSSPRGGTAKHIKENKLIAVETEKELVDKVDAFLANDECGYRKFIELLEIKRI